MTAAPDNHDAFDAQARQLHAAAVAHVSHPTLARLRTARQATAATPRRSLLAPWLAGGAVAATLAVALVLQSSLAPPTPETTGVAGTPSTPGAASPASVSADPADALQEDPGFYVWLDSVDPTALAME